MKKTIIKTILPASYPGLLPHIKPLPDHLDMIGTLPPAHYTYLCIVGSRTHSSYGIETCRHLIQGLKGSPLCIVSGLAIGIDSIAHEAALETGLPTVAFPGSGLSASALYPRSRRNLAERIISSGGALLSPFKYDQCATDWTFPVRNRLMAGISKATLIIEARQGSGTLLTATYATEFSRDVMAVPGSIYSELSYGPHMLIKSGAAVITSSQDILRELGFTATEGTSSSIDLDQLGLSDDERMICSHLVHERLTSTDIMERTSLSITRINVALTGLEMRGLVTQRMGTYGLHISS